jgi:hypothetical protein
MACLVENAVVNGPGVSRYGSPIAGAAQVEAEGVAEGAAEGVVVTAGELSIALAMFGISDIAVSMRDTVHKPCSLVKSI